MLRSSSSCRDSTYMYVTVCLLWDNSKYMLTKTVHSVRLKYKAKITHHSRSSLWSIWVFSCMIRWQRYPLHILLCVFFSGHSSLWVDMNTITINFWYDYCLVLHDYYLYNHQFSVLVWGSNLLDFSLRSAKPLMRAGLAVYYVWIMFLCSVYMGEPLKAFEQHALRS